MDDKVNNGIEGITTTTTFTLTPRNSCECYATSIIDSASVGTDTNAAAGAGVCRQKTNSPNDNIQRKPSQPTTFSATTIDGGSSSGVTPEAGTVVVPLAALTDQHQHIACECGSLREDKDDGEQTQTPPRLLSWDEETIERMESEKRGPGQFKVEDVLTPYRPNKSVSCYISDSEKEGSGAHQDILDLDELRQKLLEPREAKVIQSMNQEEEQETARRNFVEKRNIHYDEGKIARSWFHKCNKFRQS